jgi:hypothetical protein
MWSPQGNYTVPVEPIIKKGRKRERGKEGKRKKKGKKKKEGRKEENKSFQRFNAFSHEIYSTSCAFTMTLIVYLESISLK